MSLGVLLLSVGTFALQLPSLPDAASPNVHGWRHKPPAMHWSNDGSTYLSIHAWKGEWTDYGYEVVKNLPSIVWRLESSACEAEHLGIAALIDEHGNIAKIYDPAGTDSFPRRVLADIKKDEL